MLDSSVTLIRFYLAHLSIIVNVIFRITERRGGNFADDVEDTEEQIQEEAVS